MLGRARRRLPWIAPVLVLLVEAPLLWPTPHVGDWFYLWFAGHVVAGGGSPYDVTSWTAATTDYGALAGGIAHNSIAGQDLSLPTSDRWLWPPITAALLAPFGALPLEAGIPLLHLATIAVSVASALVLVRTMLPPAMRPVGLAIVVASAPAVEVMRAANPSAAILPAVALLFVALRSGSATALAGGALALFVRWSLFPLTALAAAAVFAARRAWRALALAGAAWLAVNMAAFALTPPRLDALLAAGAVRAQQDNASTWRFAAQVAPAADAPLAIAMVLAALGLVVVAVRAAPIEARGETLVAAVLALAVAVAPYTRTYDGLALLPAWLLVLRAGAASGRGALAIGAVLVAAAYGWAAYLVGAVSTQEAVALAPFLALALLAAPLAPAYRQGDG